jgi:hypothetical protein
MRAFPTPKKTKHTKDIVADAAADIEEDRRQAV